MVYTPVQDESAHLTDKPGRPRQKPQKLSQNKRGRTATPAMTSYGIKVVNPVTKGDRTANAGRYEKGRMDKSRS